MNKFNLFENRPLTSRSNRLYYPAADDSDIQITQVQNATNEKAAITETALPGSGPNTKINVATGITDGTLSKADLLLQAAGIDGSFEVLKTKYAGLSKQQAIDYAQKILFELSTKIVEQRIFDVNSKLPSYIEAFLGKIPTISTSTAGEYNVAVQLGTVRDTRWKVVPDINDIHTGVIEEGVNVVRLGKECDIYVSEKLLINMFTSGDKLISAVSLIVGQLDNSVKNFTYDFMAKAITSYPFQKNIDLSALPVATQEDLRAFTYQLVKSIKPINWLNNDWNISSKSKIISGKSPSDLVVLMPAFLREKLDIALFANLFNQGLVSNNINAVLSPENIVELPNTRLINDQDNKQGYGVNVDNPIIIDQDGYLNDGTNPYIVVFSKGAFAYATQYEIRSSAQWINYGPGLYQHKINWAFDLWKYDFEKGAKIKLPATII